MSKYDNVAQYLSLSDKDVVKLKFREVEDILGFKLPQSAYTYNAWWSNGGHSQSKSWLDVGYSVSKLNLIKEEVCFVKSKEIFKNQDIKKSERSCIKQKRLNDIDCQEAPTCEKFSLLGYEFKFLLQIIPKCNSDGSVKKYYPQKEYNNARNLPLLKNGKGAFCRFQLDVKDVAGVYLWVVNGEVIYIGETANLRTRFNTGYGIIHPRNCFFGGQSTNCKMNKVAMRFFEEGTPINLYFLETFDYKRIELELLCSVKTKYNIKDN